MKVPLRYQITNYDCASACLLNALSCLLEREEIPPTALRYIVSVCMDRFGESGEMGRRGTAHAAMRFLSDWLDRCGQDAVMPVQSRYLTGEAVSLALGSDLRAAICSGAVAAARIDLDGWHYILLTGVQEAEVLCFDPWILPEPFPVPDVKTLLDPALNYNRVVPLARFESTDIHPYSFGPYDTREAVVLRRR